MMSDWQLTGLMLLLSFFSLGLVYYPIRKSKAALCTVLPLFFICSLLAYYHWGSWSLLKNYQQEQKKIQQAKALLSTMKSPDELVQRLKAKLDKTPKSARGWYLLGKLYAHQERLSEANEAFALAKQLNPSDEEVQIYYCYNLWQLNHRQFNPQIKALLTEILQKNPNQTDALAMLASEAYDAKRYSEAQSYWEKLLRLTPEDSAEADKLRQAIAKVQSMQLTLVAK